MSFKKSPCQTYFETMFPGQHGMPFRGINKSLYENTSISAQQATDLLTLVEDEISSYYYKSLLSYAEALPAIVNKNFSWATIRLYYSVFYSTKAFLACRSIAFMRAERRMFYIRLAANEKFYRCDDTTDHKASMLTLKKLFASTDLLQSNQIDQTLAYEWMMNRREEVNYKDIDFHDPNPPDFWITLNSDIQIQGISKIVEQLVADNWLLCFQNDYGVLGIPTKRLMLTVQEIRNTGKAITMAGEQRAFVESFLSGIPDNIQHELVVWK